MNNVTTIFQHFLITIYCLYMECLTAIEIWLDNPAVCIFSKKYMCSNNLSYRYESCDPFSNIKRYFLICIAFKNEKVYTITNMLHYFSTVLFFFGIFHLCHKHYFPPSTLLLIPTVSCLLPSTFI